MVRTHAHPFIPFFFAREPPLNLVYPPFPLAPDSARLRTHVLPRGSFATVFHSSITIILDLILLRYVYGLWNDAKKRIKELEFSIVS